jgi:membrane protein YdbS with pleckstrin-like domain
MASETPQRLPRDLKRYLVPNEVPIEIVRLHWAILWKPVLATLAGLMVLGWFSLQLPPGAAPLLNLLVVAWLVIVLWLLWELMEWRVNWFVATDRRLLYTFGLITRNVAMMPLSKVTDMKYVRSPAGKVLGYGVFILESAGLDQALREIKWVPSPDKLYLEISSLIFAPPSRRFSDRYPPSTASGSALPVAERNEAWWRQ